MPHRISPIDRIRPIGPIQVLTLILCLAVGSSARADSARRIVGQGNQQYAEGQYNEAINTYNEALVEQPAAIVPKFNKANSYFRLDDLSEAIDLYQEVAAESKDMALVARAKYNLGNCFFQRGTKQRDSDLQKAVEDMKTSITYWRGVLELDPENTRAAHNIEVARLTLKDILDQLKKQQEQQKEQGQQNEDQQQRQQNQQGQQQQSPSNSPPDPNQPQDPNQTRQDSQKQDPNQTDEQKQPKGQQGQDQQQQQAQQVAVPDTTARDILDKEQRQKEQRRIFQRGRTQQVDKDW